VKREGPKLHYVTRLEELSFERWVDDILVAANDLANALVPSRPIVVDLDGLQEAARRINNRAVHINSLCMAVLKEVESGPDYVA